MLSANEVHAKGMRVKIDAKRTAFCQADDNDNVSVYLGCKECGRMDNGREVTIDNLTDTIKTLRCSCQ